MNGPGKPAGPRDTDPQGSPATWRIGNFQVVKVLGEGAMGTVYLGVHDTLHRKVAIKTIHPQLATTPQLVDRFVDEARAVSRLGHPTLVQMLDFGRLPDGRLYSVMEFLEGEELSKVLQRKGPLAPERAAGIAAEVAAGLAVAHDAGIVHRDLKPDNLYLARGADGGEQVKILDFGIAKLLDLDGGGGAKRTSAGSVLGTPAYLSPEQAKAAKLDGRADQYSLGVVLFEMLTGRVPFQSTNPMELLLAHASTPPPPLAPLCPACPRPLVAVVERLLAKEPEARYPHMRDVRAALQAAVGLGTTTSGEAVARRAPRKLGLLAIGALGVVAAGGATLAILGGGDEAETPPITSAPTPPAAGPVAPPPQPRRLGKNPFSPDDKAALAAGAAIYDAKCVRCHGETGMGDGEETPTGLEPKSFADARAFPGELDRYRFEIIRRGVMQGSGDDYAMPAFAKQLTDDEVWQVVLYLETLAGPAPAAHEMQRQQAKPPFSDELAERGARLFQKKCATCHGRSGRGNGPAAEYLGRTPADLTRGVFKIRTTPKKSLPTDEDIFRTLTFGMGVGGMPSFARMSEIDRWALVAHVKMLSGRFAREPAPTQVLTVGEPPALDAAAVERGRATFLEAGCAKCHGREGRGDGEKASKLKDDRNRPIRPPDLRAPFTFIGGSEPTDVYRTIMTGISGTPMPAGEDLFADERAAWDVVAFILSLAASPR